MISQVTIRVEPQAFEFI